MTLTAAQAMIVRAFIADERLKGGDPWCKRADVEHALRAALISKDARIVELNVEANRLSTEVGKQDAEIARLKEKLAILDIQTRHSS